MNRADLPPRMAEKIAAVGDSDACWEWTGAIQSSGYGSIGHEGRRWSTHRLAYTLLVGPIPDGLQMDHLCCNTRCCNPRHLEPVTAHENCARKADSTKLRCVQGHPLVGENLRLRTLRNGQIRRVCRACVMDTCRARRQRLGATRVHPKTLARRQAILAAAEQTLATYADLESATA